ncbi:MAG: hypothetical protein K2M40_04665 [Muribaculaceae bacterium]|nr:hypothetical protein [Muribaculaceae bacterium]
MMRSERGSLIQSIILGPIVSVVFALVGLGVMALYPGGWLDGLLSLAIAALAVYQIKGRGLYKGPNFPFAGLFMVLQAAVRPSLTSTVLAAVALPAMIGAMLCFQQRGQTRLIFLMMLVCGLGALGARCFLLLAGALMIALICLRAFSMRGFVASVLGLLTPLIILAGFGVYDPHHLVEVYGGRWFSGFYLPALIAAAPAAVFALAMFLQSYGYPAKQRARNLAMMTLTGCSLLMAIGDSANGYDYLALINLSTAYWVSHFAATRRFGWPAVLLILILAVVYGYYS